MTKESLDLNSRHTTDFNTAYKLAEFNPGEAIEFDGALPSGYITFQKIVAVPSAVNSLKLSSELAKTELKGANISISSSQERGTFIIGTFGDLKPAQL